LVGIANQEFLAGRGHDNGWVGGGRGADPKIVLDGAIRNAVQHAVEGVVGRLGVGPGFKGAGQLAFNSLQFFMRALLLET
jgi:hypothetical protein